MSEKIFVNLPVNDLDKSMAFFKALGFSFNPQFTDKPIVDAHRSTEVLVCLGVESKAEVDDLVGKALKAGGKDPRAMQDHGFMIQRSFEDLDGHIWEIIWMDPAHVQT